MGVRGYQDLEKPFFSSLSGRDGVGRLNELRKLLNQMAERAVYYAKRQQLCVRTIHFLPSSRGQGGGGDASMTGVSSGKRSRAKTAQERKGEGMQDGGIVV